MYYDIIQANKRRIIFGLVGLIILLIVWFVFDTVSHIGKIPVVIKTVPSDASITLDNKKYGNGTQWLVAGKYNLTVSKDGFGTEKKSVLITPKKSQNVIAVSLGPKSDEAKKWANEHSNDYKNNEQYGAIEANVNGQYFSDMNPITTKLPFTDPYFTIGYITNGDGSVKLTVSTPSPRYRFFAIEKIREFGYEPTDFVIVFKDFKNPLEEK